jgi:hypothetical protein
MNNKTLVFFITRRGKLRKQTFKAVKRLRLNVIFVLLVASYILYLQDALNFIHVIKIWVGIVLKLANR